MIHLQCVSITRYVTKFLNATVTRDDYHCANERFASNFTSRAEFTRKFVQFDFTGEKNTTKCMHRQRTCLIIS